MSALSDFRAADAAHAADVAAARAAAAAHTAATHVASHSAGDDVLGVILGAIFGGVVGACILSIILGVVLGLAILPVAKFWPKSRGLNYLRMAHTLCFWWAVFTDDDGARQRFLGLIRVWIKSYVGNDIVFLDERDGVVHHLKIASTWWNNGAAFGSFLTPSRGWVNLTHLHVTGQAQVADGCWYFTAARWAVMEPEWRAHIAEQQEQRRQQEANHANRRAQQLSRDVEEAMIVLGLTPAARLADVKAAHLRLIKVNHPDRGGSVKKAQVINAAHDLLCKVLS
jgi:hypothetical protein